MKKERTRNLANKIGFTEDVFFYHSDHLGSTSYVTDGDGNATQFVAYTPFGESLVDEHAVTFETPYKFNGKEMDAETGLYYYGARYYDPSLALWYGVDALAEKYPSLGGYVYCANNPVRLIDPDGRKPLTANDRKKAEESRLLCYKMAFSYLESAEISQCQDVQAKLQYMALLLFKHADDLELMIDCEEFLFTYKESGTYDTGYCEPDKNGVIVICYPSIDGGQQHEETHCAQFKKGEISTQKHTERKNKNRYIGYGIEDEIVAMKIEYAIVGASNDRLKELFNIKNIDDIDSKKTENRLYWLYSDVFENRYENTDK